MSTSQPLEILTFVGHIEAVLFVFAVGYAIYLWTSGIAPVLLRLGNGLAKRKIVIFAKGDNLTSIKSLLIDSKLFRTKNVCEVAQERDIEKAEGATVYLVYWPDWGESIEEILKRKKESCALIVYQPYDQGRIPDEQMKVLDGKRNTAVTNFRGRLLNDIVTAMITTDYEKE